MEADMTMRTDEMMQGWAAYEFAEADLGDARRTQRLIDLAETLGQRPTASLPAACGDPATLKAAYRFFDNDDISAEAILASHGQWTPATCWPRAGCWRRSAVAQLAYGLHRSDKLADV
jgi:hypothetical protein